MAAKMGSGTTVSIGFEGDPHHPLNILENGISGCFEVIGIQLEANPAAPQA
jgi:hypothetical protein